MFGHGDKLIVHVDVDAFFASVEQLLIPALRGRAVIVGSGCIASCSYEARRFGLHAGMSLRRARELCPDAVVLAGRYPIYHCFAEHVWEICRRYTCGLETFLDEACGDATGMRALWGDPPALGRKLQSRVAGQVGLPVSVGLASNRMLAKMASHSAKPNGVVWIAPGREREFLAPLAIDQLPGVGPKTRRRLGDINIHTVGELRSLGRDVLRCMFGRPGELLYERCRGRDAGHIRPGALPKSISRETTFHQPQCNRDWIRAMLSYLVERAMRAARGAKLLAGAVEVSIRYVDFHGDAMRRALPTPADCDEEVFAVATELLDALLRRRVALRHVGVVLSRFSRAGEARSLFEPRRRERSQGRHRAVDAIRSRWGHGAVVSGESIALLGQLDRNDHGFVLRTPSLTK